MPEDVEPRSLVTRTLVQNGRATARRIRCYQLVVAVPGSETTLHRVDGARCRLGSHPSNDVVLADPAVSRLHVEITPDDEGFRIRDSGSRNGTYVDGLRVRDAYLGDGATIRIGASTLRFELLASEAEIALAADDHFAGLVGRNPRMRELYTLIERAAPTAATVLISGENGTGKELVARAVHDRSRRAQRPFVVFDCAAVAPELLESELFGHERGAFSGAMRTKPGLAEEADGGTLFLDELGELPLDLQPKLLRMLQEREIRRVGSNKTRAVDLRVIAATNRDLTAEIARGAFRTDLYYRLAVVQLEVPPLRNRTEDIPLLVRHFASEVTGDEERAGAITDAFQVDGGWARLSAHPWPGNVRELRNLVVRTVLLGEVPQAGASEAPSAPTTPFSFGVDLARPLMGQKRAIVASFEETYLRGVLAKHGGNYSRAAAAAGVDRMYFKRMLKRYEDPGL